MHTLIYVSMLPLVNGGHANAHLCTSHDINLTDEQLSSLTSHLISVYVFNRIQGSSFSKWETNLGLGADVSHLPRTRTHDK